MLGCCESREIVTGKRSGTGETEESGAASLQRCVRKTRPNHHVQSGTFRSVVRCLDGKQSKVESGENNKQQAGDTRQEVRQEVRLKVKFWPKAKDYHAAKKAYVIQHAIRSAIKTVDSRREEAIDIDSVEQTQTIIQARTHEELRAAQLRSDKRKCSQSKSKSRENRLKQIATMTPQRLKSSIESPTANFLQGTSSSKGREATVNNVKQSQQPESAHDRALAGSALDFCAVRRSRASWRQLITTPSSVNNPAWNYKDNRTRKV